MSEGGRRLALVVATTEYDDARLDRLAAPLADALELARTLGVQGDFEVESLVNAEAQTVQRRLERFCKTGRHPSDTLFVYLTGHGVKDDEGNLYFALRDTDRDLLRTTALSADLVSSILNESPASSQILMLDCCYSGAFARALRPKGSSEIDIARTFGGSRGRVVLAASGAVEQAWEGAGGSLYTHAVVEGIVTGAADLDANGEITAAEIHSYTSDRLRAEGRQSPRKFEFDEAGRLVIARAGNAPAPVGNQFHSPTTSGPIGVDRPEPRLSRASRPRRRAPAWIPGMVAVALATLLGTLWLVGAISFLPSPLTSTTTAPAPPTGTSPLVVSTLRTETTDLGTGSTTGQVATTAITTVEFQRVFEEAFDANLLGWTEGQVSTDGGDSFYRFTAGLYEARFNSSIDDQIFYSAVPFAPGPGLYYIETRTSASLPTSRCGLSLQTDRGGLFVAMVGAGEAEARSFADGLQVRREAWVVSVGDPSQTEIGIWVDGSAVTVYVDDVEIATVEEPAIAAVSQIGVSLAGGTEAQCTFEHLSLWIG